MPIVRRCWDAVRGRYPDHDEARLGPELVRDQIGLMVNDVLEETQRRVAEAGVASCSDVRSAGRPLAGFSGRVAMEERELKRFLYARMYNAPAVTAVRSEAQRVIANLAAAYRDDPRRLPPDWQAGVGHAVTTLRRIGDFIAGMTDRYAVARHRDLVGPVELPEGF